MEILLYIVGAACLLAIINVSEEVTTFDFAMTIIVMVLSFGLASIISVLKKIESKIRGRHL